MDIWNSAKNYQTCTPSFDNGPKLQLVEILLSAYCHYDSGTYQQAQSACSSAGYRTIITATIPIIYTAKGLDGK